ncbi:MAG: glycosyltransferase 87 family protein [Thermoleophilia bacterium]
MRSGRALPWLAVALAALVWAVPLQLGFYSDAVITDIPTYRAAYEHIAAGGVPYVDFSLEYPPLAAALFWLAGVIPGDYTVVFSVLMALCLVAVVLGVLAIARALDLDRRHQALAAAAVALSPLLIGNLVESRFDMALAALLTWTLWAAVTERWRLMWTLLAAATLLKVVPLILVPVLLIWQRHRDALRRALVGLAWSLAVVVVAIAPFAIMSPSGTWDLARYHLDRPLQIEATGSAYLLGLHAMVDVPITVVNSYGSQGLDGTGPQVIAGLSTALLIALVVAIAAGFWIGLHRSRAPGDARLLVAATASTVAALLVAGKVLSPQFLVWLVPLVFIVAGRYGPAAFGLGAAAMLATLAYFPHRYWDLVALHTPEIAILALRDTLLIALLAACWPRADVSSRPQGRILPGQQRDVERAVAARYLVE